MKHLTRRDFGKLSGALGALAMLPAVLLTGCGVDSIISALELAATVAANAAQIQGIAGTRFETILKTVSADLLIVVDLYKKYDAGAGDKPTIFRLIQATLSTITNNLAEILTAVHVFNSNLRDIITTAVAIVNTAISLIISHLPATHQKQARARRLSLPTLPQIDGAKNASDLKKAWNDAVQGSYPDAAVK